MSSGQETSLRRVRSESPSGGGGNAVNSIVTKFESESSKGHRRTLKDKGRNNKSDFQRSGSFRNKHKVKQQDSEMSGTSRMRQGDPRTWRIHHFGHYDLQSVSVDRLSWQAAQADPEYSSKKPTGASAAYAYTHYGESAEERGNCFNTLVAHCPPFCTEVGEDRSGPEGVVSLVRDTLSQEKKMRLCSREKVVLDGHFPDDVDSKETTSNVFTVQSGLTYPFEFIDYGACYYRKYFYEREHQNFVGIDDAIGPIVISLRREKVPEEVLYFFSHGQPNNDRGTHKYQYRVVVRTTELLTLRGTILEEAIPSSGKVGSNKGLPPKEVIDYVVQSDIQTSMLKLARQDDKVHRELMRLDEQDLSNKYKVGIIYCKPGQTSEEEWYNNEKGSFAFEEFLELIGQKVKMKGFSKYRAQLDNKTNTTGEHSIYTEFEDNEIMFHVSTLLPYTATNKQQLLRKRHIGNDIVTIIFQEPGSEPFSPHTIRSHFQHIFIIVRVVNPNSHFTEYRVAVSRSKSVPYFGPPIPENGTFQKSERFRKFLLTKLVNACNAGLHSDKLYAMASRTRRQYLIDMCKEQATSASIDQVGPGGLGRLFRSKRERSGLIAPLIYTPGSVCWSVSIIFRRGKPLPFSDEHDYSIDCTLCLAPDVLVFVNEQKMALLHIPTKDISGYCISPDKSRLNLFYDNCHCVSLVCPEEREEDVQEIAKRITAVSSAQEAFLVEFARSRMSGLLGFTIDQDGAVVKVDGLARTTGLQKGARVLQVEDKLIAYHPQNDIVNLLHDKYRLTIRTFVIPPIPKFQRPCLVAEKVDWSGVWSVRPQPIGEDEPEENKKPSPIMSENRRMSNGHLQVNRSSRRSYLEAISLSENQGSKRRNRPENLHIQEVIYDRLPLQHQQQQQQQQQLSLPASNHAQPEIIYDRLMTFEGNPSSPSSKSTGSISAGPSSPAGLNKPFSRMRVPQHKAIRSSVLQLANSIMDQGSEELSPIDHVVEEYAPHVQTHVSQSMHVPDRRHTVSPLSALHRQPRSAIALGERHTENMPHHGQVQNLARKFSLQSPVSKNAPVQFVGGGGIRKSAHVPIIVGVNQQPILSVDNTAAETTTVQPRARRRSSVNRPLSWDASIALADGPNEPIVENSSPQLERAAFEREAQTRMPVRVKSPSRNDQSSPIASPSQDDATKCLDEVLEQYGEVETPGEKTSQESSSSGEEKVMNMSVRARTQLWEMKAYYRTLPRSFKHKQRSVSQPSSPMRTTGQVGPATNSLTPADTSTSAIRPRHSVFNYSAPQPPASYHKQGVLREDDQEEFSGGDSDGRNPEGVTPKIFGSSPLSPASNLSRISMSNAPPLLPYKPHISSHRSQRRSLSPTPIEDMDVSPQHRPHHQRLGKVHSTSGITSKHSRRPLNQHMSETNVVSPHSYSENHFMFDSDDAAAVISSWREERENDNKRLEKATDVKAWVSETERAAFENSLSPKSGSTSPPTCNGTDKDHDVRKQLKKVERQLQDIQRHYYRQETNL